MAGAAFGAHGPACNCHVQRDAVPQYGGINDSESGKVDDARCDSLAAPFVACEDVKRRADIDECLLHGFDGLGIKRGTFRISSNRVSP
jgi:hypothetical protein